MRPSSPASSLPAVDERLVMPETRHEIIDGRVVYVPPADEPHGTWHSRLGALLEAHKAAGYSVALDMLTRTSKKGDLAPDASVFPTARDETTGGRRLEELAFEILGSERLGHSARKARALTARGVRRVFALDLEKRRTLAWSPSADAWEELLPDSVLDDRAFAVPLPVAALVDVAAADRAVAEALLARKDPVIEEALAAREVAGKMAALLAILSARNIHVSKDQANALRAAAAADGTKLDAWLKRAISATRLDDVIR